MDKPKKTPYALTNFERIRTENYLYVISHEKQV